MTRGYGKAKKPEDYLQEFSAFIKSHSNTIPALVTVLTRPRELTRKQLRELVMELDKAGFTEAGLSHRLARDDQPGHCRTHRGLHPAGGQGGRGRGAGALWVMAAKGAAGGFVVTSGRFTDEAKSFAEGRNVRLVDGSSLHGMIRQAQGSARPEQDVAKSEQAAKGAPPSEAPTCPACAKAMVRRTAKRGANAGGEFWGAYGYPACKGTRAIG